MRAALLLALAAAARAAAPAAEPPAPRDPRQAECLAKITPELLIRRGAWKADDGALGAYAACRELVDRSDALCRYFPGGPDSAEKGPPEGAVYTYVGTDGKVHRTAHFGVCSSHSAGYVFLALQQAGAPREELARYAARLLHGEKDVTPDQIVDDALAIARTGKLESARTPAIARAGFLHYLLGRPACAKVGLEKLRRECYQKAAALEALKAGDPRLCRADDLMCRALVEGESACGEPAREAVELFCGARLPKMRLKEEEWRRLSAPL